MSKQPSSADMAPYVKITKISGVPPELMPEEFVGLKSGDKLSLSMMNLFSVEVTDNLEESYTESGERPKRTPSIEYYLNFIRNNAAQEWLSIYRCEYRRDEEHPEGEKHSFFDDLFVTDAADYWKNQIKTEQIISRNENLLMNSDPENKKEQGYSKLVLAMARENLHRLNTGGLALLRIPYKDEYEEAKNSSRPVHIPNSFLKKCESISGFYKVSIPKDQKSWQYFLLPEEFIEKDTQDFCQCAVIPSGKSFETSLTIQNEDGFQTETISNKELIDLINNGIRTYGMMVQNEASENLQKIENSPTLQDRQKKNIEKAIAEKLNPAPWRELPEGGIYQNMNLVELDQKQNFFAQNVLIALGAVAGGEPEIPAAVLQSERG